MANNGNRRFKPYEELEFRDDFMFGKVMEDPVLCHDVLECLLQRKIGKLDTSHPQKEFQFISDGKPIRMDIFSRTEDEVFDAEVQNLNKQAIASLELPRRTRFYQASVDSDFVRKGDSYKTLPESTILFICTFDPLGKGLDRYTFRERCIEDDTLLLGDGTTKVFYNCTYKGDNIPDDLKHLYEYIDNGKTGSDLTKRIHKAVNKARKIEEWRSMYMKEMVLLMDAREEGREEGRVEGREEGREEERKNTEVERQRADVAEAKVQEFEARVRELETMLAALTKPAS